MPSSDRAANTREELLDAGERVAEVHGLAGLSINQVVAAAGVAKGTFYVHFVDRSAFVDALHERFHSRVVTAIRGATEGIEPGVVRLLRATDAYLDACRDNRAVKALAHEALSDPSLTASISARNEKLITGATASFRVLGWPDPTAASRLLGAMTREVAVRELEAGRRLPSMRRALQRFVGE